MELASTCLEVSMSANTWLKAGTEVVWNKWSRSLEKLCVMQLRSLLEEDLSRVTAVLTRRTMWSMSPPCKC